MWEERAHRARRDIAALAASGLGIGDLYEAAIRRVDRDVRTELTCWVVLDPETLVISTVISGEARLPTRYEPLLAASEYAADQPHRFATLAGRREPVARSSDLSASARAHSIRLQEIWRPLGVDHEVRAVFSADGTAWGAAGMVRGGSDFTDRETDFLAAVGPALAAATRLAVRSEAAARDAQRQPAVVIIDDRGRIRTLTAEAADWRARLDLMARDRFSIMMQVMAGGARATGVGGFRTRIRDADGHWAVLRASPLTGGGDDGIAVTIEPAAGEQLTALLLQAYELSVREREVCGEVMAGRPTDAIADRLFISRHTVQDHLKSIFAKVGVRSRGELVARLRPDRPG
jgi:DNA-binding CsgD family transcriptional regulator